MVALFRTDKAVQLAEHAFESLTINYDHVLALKSSSPSHPSQNQSPTVELKSLEVNSVCYWISLFAAQTGAGSVLDNKSRPH